MNSENHTFLQVLRIPNVEFWYSRDSDLVFSSEDDIQILFSKSLNQFILRHHNFKMMLDKSVHFISSIVGRHQRQAYIFPRGIGFSMFRLADAKTSPALQNFETILENTANFSQKSGLESTLVHFKEIKENTGLAGSLLNSMTKVFGHSSNDSHPNQKIARSFDQLLDIDSHGAPVVDIADSELTSLNKKNELDGTGSEQSDLWKSFMGQGSFAGFAGEVPEMKEGHQRTSDIQQPQVEKTKMSEMGENKEMKGDPHMKKFHPSIDHQETVGAQNQRLPSYEVQNSKEFLQKNLRKASANVPSNEVGSGDDQNEENVELPEPVHFEDEAFTFGLLTKDVSQIPTVGINKDFPVANEDAFVDLTHPMRKFSSADRPFLGIEEESERAEADKPRAEPHKGFQGHPILTAKGMPTLKSNIDDQPSPIPNTEKYSEPTQPEKSSFAKSNDAQPIKPSALGEQNIVRESSQGNETKKHRKPVETVDKENFTSPTAI